MKRDELEPEVLYCVERIERVIQSLYFDYSFCNNFEPKHLDFIYRIELDAKDKSKTPRIRFRAGSTKTSQQFYVGDAEPALRALVFLRNKLCNTALHDLQKLLSSDLFPQWFYKNCPDKTKSCPIDPERITYMVFEIAKALSSKFSPYPIDIDDLSGFFIDEADNPHIVYKRLESTVYILESEASMYGNICRAIKEVTPSSAIYSFSRLEIVGKYWIGRLDNCNSYISFDIGWMDTKYVLRMVSLVGFPRINSNQPKRPKNDMHFFPWPPKKE